MSVTATMESALEEHRLEGPVDRIDGRRLAALSLVLLVGSLFALVMRSSIASAAALQDRAADLGWFPIAAAPVLWISVPLAVLGAMMLVMSPGLLLAVALDRARSVEEWVLHAFALSLPVVSLAAAAVQAATGTALRAGGFFAVVLSCAAASGMVVAMRLRRRPLRWPFAAPYAWQTIAGMALVPVVLLIALAPKFHWEVFNGDGAHAFEASRLLLHQAVPFWDPGAGDVTGFPGITSFVFAYPTSWFLRLFGELEASARIPLLLYLPVLAAGIIALANHAAPRALGAAERWLIWSAIVVYTLVVAFNATYSPYSADLALPATQDTLLMVAFLGFLLSFVRRAWGWAALFALYTYLSLPNGLLLLGFWLIAWVLVSRPLPWRDAITGGAIIVGCMVAAKIAPLILTSVGAPSPGGEYSGGRLLVRFAFLQVTDWTRLLYVIVPCGIAPALALVAWRRQDRLARAVTLVTIAYFLFAFVQLRSSLHYYIPAMLLPLVVYWRITPREGAARGRVLAATAVAAGIAFALAFPTRPGPYLAPRAIGASIEDRVGGYDRMTAEQFRASTALHHVIPYDWDRAVPERALGTSPLVLLHYAHRAGDAGARNYVLQRASDPPPAGASLIGEEDGFAVYVRDSTVWRSHLALRPPSPPGAPVFRQERGILFSSEPLVSGPYVIDLPAIATRLGIDVDGLARSMGVER